MSKRTPLKKIPLSQLRVRGSLVFCFIQLGLSASVQAFMDDDGEAVEVEPSVVVTQSNDYIGARDESELIVRESLPNPSRVINGPPERLSDAESDAHD